MADYTKITETLWIAEPVNWREKLSLEWLRLRKRVFKLLVRFEDGSERKVYALKIKNGCIDEFKATLRPGRTV